MAKYQTLNKKKLYNRVLHKKIFKVSDFAIQKLLEISINWHTKSQGPKKKCIHFQEGESAPPKPPIIRVVLLHKQRFVESFFPPTVCSTQQIESHFISYIYCASLVSKCSDYLLQFLHYNRKPNFEAMGFFRYLTNFILCI